MRPIIEAIGRRAGREFSVDPEIPSGFLASEIISRTFDLLRSIVKLHSIAFVGSRTIIKSKKRMKLGRFATIGRESIIDCSGSIGVTLGRGAKIGRRSIVTTTSHLGKQGTGLFVSEFSAIGDYAHIGCSGGVMLGRNVIAGPYVTFHSQEHNTESTVNPIRLQGTTEVPIRIGDDVWIGARCTFLAGAIVGSHSVVAAGSVVRGEFPGNVVIGGIPARILKHRR